MPALALHPFRGGTSLVMVMALLAIGLVNFVSPSAAKAAEQTFNYTGDVQSWTVPAGVSSLHIVVEGGDGGQVLGVDSNWAAGVKGAAVSTLLNVTPGDELEVRVGGAG